MKKNDQAYSSWGADDLRYFRNKLNVMLLKKQFNPAQTIH